MPDMSYDSGGLRAGGSRALAAAAETAIGHLLGATIAVTDFGDVAGAEVTAADLTSTRDGYARTGHRWPSCSSITETTTQPEYVGRAPRRTRRWRWWVGHYRIPSPPRSS